MIFAYLVGGFNPLKTKNSQIGSFPPMYASEQFQKK